MKFFKLIKHITKESQKIIPRRSFSDLRPDSIFNPKTVSFQTNPKNSDNNFNYRASFNVDLPSPAKIPSFQNQENAQGSWRDSREQQNNNSWDKPKARGYEWLRQNLPIRKILLEISKVTIPFIVIYQFSDDDVKEVLWESWQIRMLTIFEPSGTAATARRSQLSATDKKRIKDLQSQVNDLSVNNSLHIEDAKKKDEAILEYKKESFLDCSMRALTGVSPDSKLKKPILTTKELVKSK